MVKAVIGDETRLKFAENRLASSVLHSQVGLVLGKLNPKLDRGFVYDLVPTPPSDGGEPPCSVIDGPGESSNIKKKNTSKSKSRLESSALWIDQEWVSEHARQVSRMLLGGVKVVGIYIWVNEGLFKNSTITLCQTVKGVAEAASLLMTGCSGALLVHISPSPLRWTCKSCSLAANITSSTLRPCDFRTGKVLGSLQTFRCSYNFDLRLPVTHEAGGDIRRFSDVLRDEMMVHAKELTVAKALIDGKLVAEDDLSVPGDFHEVEFLLPLLQDKYIEACNKKEVLGVLHFKGSVCSLSYLNSKESVSQALLDIKEDITRSLQSRLEIMCDEAERYLESVNQDGLEPNIHPPIDKPDPRVDLLVQSKQCTLSFPRRVFVPWLEGTYICDYILPSETMEAVQDHCVELMCTEFPEDSSEILEPESEATIVTVSANKKTFWAIATDYSSTAISDNSVSKSKEIRSDSSWESMDLKTVISILVPSLAIIVWLVFYILGIE
ncbi:oxidoreductase- zinc-binding dehydrogenase family protein [Striga hermonthica]|uniref:Oxidoreductase- zinc-binding dehydrogenase family protein n=1 Tax=Striga hermonthica TaxID=68872 RepID=A0A9N7QZ83_STRHE|nr:oxidoreductase- zinc-binding dehydrogenase family protein [Striga hermonthica]